MAARAFVAAFVAGTVLGVAPAARADGSPVASATADEEQRAQAEFEAAVVHYKAGRYDQAAAGFEASFAIVASPNSAVMLGKSLAKGGRLVAAYETLRQASVLAHDLADRMPRYARAADLADRELATVRIQIFVIPIEVTGDAEGAVVRVGGREIPRDRWAEGVPALPGDVEVVAATSDGRTARTIAEGRAADEVPVVLKLPRRPAKPVAAPPEKPARRPARKTSRARPQRRPARQPAPVEPAPGLVPFAAIAGGVAAGGLATFAVAGALTRSTNADLEHRCPAKRCRRDLEGTVDRGRQQQLVANVGLGVALVAASAGVTLLVLDGSSSGRSSGQPAGRIRFVASPSDVSLRGRF